MNRTLVKSDLVDAIAEKTGFGWDIAADGMEAFLRVITDALRERDRVKIEDFGVFEVTVWKERTTPRTHIGGGTTVPELVRVGFKPGKGFRDAVEEGYRDQDAPCGS